MIVGEMMSPDKRNQMKYDDMIHLRHPISKKHPQMSLSERAAQFSPFAALTGYEGAIRETARLTKEKIQLDEIEKNLLDEKLRTIQHEIGNKNDIEITFYVKDKQKSGGEYQTIKGFVKKIDANKHVLIMQDETKIEIDDILEIKGELFRFLEDFFS